MAMRRLPFDIPSSLHTLCPMSSHIQPYCTRCLMDGACPDGVCDACHSAAHTATLGLASLIPTDGIDATLASQSGPRSDAGLGADLWAMFSRTHAG